jgi:heat shock protein HslJ
MIRACCLSLLLVACSTPATDPAKPIEAPQTAPVSGPPLGEAVPDGAAVEGEWRVAGVAGRPIDQAEAITASILPGEIRAVAGCVRWTWSYRLSKGVIALQRRPSASPPCARPLTAIERDFEQAVLQATFAVRRPDGSLTLAGAGGEVVLFRQ